MSSSRESAFGACLTERAKGQVSVSLRRRENLPSVACNIPLGLSVENLGLSYPSDGRAERKRKGEVGRVDPPPAPATITAILACLVGNGVKKRTLNTRLKL